MSKKILLSKDARDTLQKGFDFVGTAAGSTLGPKGKTVIIAPGYGHMPVATKDGVTVVKSCFVDDEVENVGVMMIRYASEKTLADCGDGTTSSAVLAQSMINAGLEVVDAGADSSEVKLGMEKAVDMVVSRLKEIAIPVTDNEMIKSIATISANNDEEIGKKLAEAYEKIGNNGILTIEKSKTVETYITINSGSEMQRGYANEKFVTNPAKMTVEYDDAYVLVCNYEIKTVKEMAPFLEQFAKMYDMKTTPLVIIAKGFEGEFHNTAVVNRVQGGVKICLVEAPNMYQKEALIDIATVTGATLITDDAGLKLESARTEHLGMCKKIVIGRVSTMVIDGNSNPSEVEALKGQINNLIDIAADEQIKDVWVKRLARLSGRYGVIYVGGATEIEQKERHDRVDDANRAVKSAIEEGVVPGGGLALIRASEFVLPVTGDQALGANVVLNACYAPLKKMLINAGRKDVSDVVEYVAGQDGNNGINVKTGEYVDMIEAKIIDPAKVVRCAIQNAASVAAQVINSEVLLVEMKPKD